MRAASVLLVVALALAASAGSGRSERSQRSAASEGSGACAVCACTGDTVQCSGGTLRGLPLPLPALAKHLTLEDVDLSEESAGSGACGEWGAGLASLWARACGVRELRACWLAGAARSLHALDLARNALERLEEGALPALPALHTLSLRRNRIHYVAAGALSVAPALRVLRLDGNRLRALSGQLAVLVNLRELWLGEQPLERVGGAGWAGGGAALQLLELRGAGLQRLEADALQRLPALRTLVLAGSGWAAHAPLAVHSRRLDALRLDSCRLSRLPAPPCRLHPALRTLNVRSNLLTAIPDLSGCVELRVLDLSWNAISSLGREEGQGGQGGQGGEDGEEGGAWAACCARLHDLLLAHNRLLQLPAHAFLPLASLQLLDLEDNRIEYIDADAFAPLSTLEELNVGSNVFEQLPTRGLGGVRHLRAHNNPRLRRFPSPRQLPRVQSLLLSYAYHCCEWLEGAVTPDASRALLDGDGDADTDADAAGFSDFVVIPARTPELAAWANTTDFWPYLNNASGELSAGSVWAGASPGRGAPGVRCLPRPGPFLPCEDLFDWWTLRCGVWVVFLLALLGNGTVVFVLLASRTKMDVPRFLVANLAAADFCMGLYLGFLAVVDAMTLGEFRAHALSWQVSGACQLAGFLAVLGSELSVFTLAVITLERNYAITHAMHLNKRLSLRHAAAVMTLGWAFALTAAALPLAGVSDYRKFAVCLPFETSSPAALGYVVAVLAINGLAFLVLLGCYLKMYCAIRGSQAWNSNDSRIAKRMALLVFTDFLCWSPIAFFALTAAFGLQLVSLEQAKVFTVFVLPLNSCCNPFLYAILTKQFKKDCALVCKAIEESRVTRGIGRCRHSSNFSNRQTPANTNSLVERSSRGGGGGAAGACACSCRAHLLPGSGSGSGTGGGASAGRGAGGGGAEAADGAPLLLRWLAAACGPRTRPHRTPHRPAPPPRVPRRHGSVSSSVEFSSSRSDSWRGAGGGGAGARGAGRAEGGAGGVRRAASWLVARNASHDSTLSSSRNDSSGSGATTSTGTWRTSRSAGGAGAGAGAVVDGGAGPASTAGAAATTVAAAAAARPRLQRQGALLLEDSPARTLHTIPSAAEPDDALLAAPTAPAATASTSALT